MTVHGCGMEQFRSARAVRGQTCKAGGVAGAKASFADGVCVWQPDVSGRFLREVMPLAHHAFQQGHAEGVGTEVIAAVQVLLKAGEELRVEGIVGDRMPPSQIGHVLAPEFGNVFPLELFSGFSIL